jgi:predicted Zn-dependent protease
MHLALAQLLMKDGSYKEAAQEFQNVLDSFPDNALAQTGLQAAREAAGIKEQGSRYTVKRMDVFNSRRAEYSPCSLATPTASSISLPAATRRRATGSAASQAPNWRYLHVRERR